MSDNRIYIDRGWKFSEQYSEGMSEISYDESSMKDVTIPHNVAQMPLHYFDESIYQMECCYRRHIVVKDEWKDKVILLTFEGVAHECDVYVNGNRVCGHSCGYTAFTADISRYLEYGRDNVIAVRVDSREDLDQPPFGFAIDYMTYGGIYRDVYIEVKPRAYISRTVISTKLIERFEKEGKRFCRKGAVIAKVYNEGCSGREVLTAYIRRKGSEEKLGSDRTEVTEGYTEIAVRIDDVELWDVENPALYELVTVLADSSKGTADERIDTFGFRKAVFRANGFFLNGR